MNGKVIEQFQCCTQEFITSLTLMTRMEMQERKLDYFGFIEPIRLFL